MKTTRFFLFTILTVLSCYNVSLAQVSQIVYSADSLSGELRVMKADLATTNTYVWTIKLPTNSSVKVTRINNAPIFSPNVYLFENDTRQILNNPEVGEFSEIITGAGALTFVLDRSCMQVSADPIIVIKFSKVSKTNSTIIHDGNLELTGGILRAFGHQEFAGSKIAAVLGNDYASYTCFGAINGGRIRGSNEGYLILEGNTNGYGSPTVYINRYTASGNVVMTSYSGKVGIGVDVPREKLHIDGAIRGNGTGGALRIKTEYGILELGAQDNTGVHFSTTRPKFIFNQNMEIRGSILATE